MLGEQSTWRSWEIPLYACLLWHLLRPLLLSNLRILSGITFPLALHAHLLRGAYYCRACSQVAPFPAYLFISCYCRLSWTASTDATVLGYYVYRAAGSIQSKFTKITRTLVPGKRKEQYQEKKDRNSNINNK